MGDLRSRTRGGSDVDVRGGGGAWGAREPRPARPAGPGRPGRRGRRGSSGGGPGGGPGRRGPDPRSAAPAWLPRPGRPRAGPAGTLRRAQPAGLRLEDPPEQPLRRPTPQPSMPPGHTLPGGTLPGHMLPRQIGAEPARVRLRPDRLPAAAPLRLTRRGRVVLTSVFLVAALVLLATLGARSAATSGPAEADRTRTVEVSEGDTLWGIAAGIAGPGEVRDVVYEIRRLNGLSGSALVEGQRLAVPAGEAAG